MARSFVSLTLQAARAAERAAKAEARAQERAIREAAAEARRQERFDKQQYAAARQRECDSLNEELQERLGDISQLLSTSLARSPTFTWQQLSKNPSEAELDKDPTLALPRRPSEPQLPTLGPFSRLIPGARSRHAQKCLDLQNTYGQQMDAYGQAVRKRANAYDALCIDIDRYNRGVDVFRSAYRSGDSEAVAGIVQLALDHSQLPEGFHDEYRVAFSPASRQVVVEYRIPSLEEAIPTVEKCRYVKSRDVIEETKRSAKGRQALYADLVAQLTLRLASEVFRADQDEVIGNVILNMFVRTVDPATGLEVAPCLVSLRTTRDQFMALNLRNVEPAACLKNLSAAVSRSPAELVPVKPILEFDMVDPRFIQESDVLSALDHRTNLMDLTPADFENLITNLFAKMGLETKLTQASRDGGVDCVAYDQRPILGGKVVIQAKRYKNTVGVSAVRDLFGTMHNEGANKGILVTTSGYGSAAHQFANGKPIELIDGGNLLYLLKEHANIDAKIEMPDDWVDH
ncbi:MAG: restriction endonuclease [Hyphomicrobiaceae bacterium]